MDSWTGDAQVCAAGRFFFAVFEDAVLARRSMRDGVGAAKFEEGRACQV